MDISELALLESKRLIPFMKKSKAESGEELKYIQCTVSIELAPACLTRTKSLAEARSSSPLAPLTVTQTTLGIQPR